MAITSKRVSSAAGNSSVVIEWYSASGDDRLTITINGINFQFPTYDGQNSVLSREDTIAALKEAAAQL